MIRFWRITISSAAPIDPPTRCSTFNAGVARGTCSRFSVAYAAAIAGISAPPSPIPRSTSAALTTQ